MAKIFSSGIFKTIGKLFGFGGNNWVFAVLALVGMFTKKKKKPEEINNKNSNSPVYGWEGVTTTADTDIPVPLIFGRHQVGGNIVNTHIKSELVENIQNELTTLTDITSSDDKLNKRLTYITPTVNGSSTKLIQFDIINNVLTAVGTGNFGTIGAQSSKIEYDDIYIAYKKEAATEWFYLPYIKADSIRISAKTTMSFNIDPLYNGKYHIRLSHQGVIKQISGKATQQSISSYNKITIGNAYKYVTYFVGTNSSTAQTLYLDVALGVGQLEGLVGIQVNDQYVADYTSEKDIDKKSVRIKHEFKAGHDLLVPFNKNDFITVQSSVFNKNASITRVCRTTLMENANAGTNTLKVAGAYLMFDIVGHRSVIRLYDHANPQGYHDYIIAVIDGDNVTLSSNLTESYLAGDYVYAPDETQVPDYSDTGEFTNFTYTTQGDYIDSLDIGLNAPNGLYTVDNEGKYQIGRVSYELWVAHETTAIEDIESSYIHHEVVNLIGGREGRIWYNKLLDTSILTINPINKKKQYHIKLKKVHRDNYESIAKNDLQIAYIEEIKNKDIYYNNTGYVSLIMPADSKLNGGTPTFKFEVEGLHVPCMLPSSLVIDGDTSNTNTIYLKNHDNTTNYNSNSTDYQLNVLAGYIGASSQKIDLDNWINSLTCATTAISSNYRGRNILTGYFKCGDKWYKKYCILKTNAYADQIISADIEAYKSKIVILTEGNLNALKTEYAAIPDLVSLFTDVSYIYKETALPSTPTDMVLYKWSDNPAECLLHVLTNEDNGLGIPFSQIDLASFIEARDYFNEHVADPLNNPNTMKRCVLNIVLDTVENARSHIDKICATCHSALYETNGIIKIVVDKAAEEPLITLNEDDHLIADSLKVVSLPSKELPNQINITYLNKDNNYARDPITVEDPKLSRSVGYGALRKMEMDLKGITDESHAYLEGLRLIKSARYVNFSISFKTALSGFPFEIGDVFRLESTTFGWGTLDADGLFIPGSGKRFKVMTVKHAENAETEITAIEYFDEIYTLDAEDLITYNTVRHTSLPNPSQKPSAVKNLVLKEENFRNASGDITLNILGYFNPPNTSTLIPNNRIAFLGVAGSIGHTTLNLKSSDEARRFKVGDKITFNTDLIEGSDDSSFPTVTAVYSDYGLKQIVISPALAADLPVDSFISKMEYSMTKYEYNKFYYAVVDVYDTNGVAVMKGVKSDNNSFKIVNVATGTYTCVIHSVSARGIVGDYTSASITITGRQTSPEDKSLTLTATAGPYKNSYYITWDAATDKDIRSYKLTIAPNFVDPVIPTVTKTIIHPLEYTHTFTVSGSYTITLVTVNTSGIESTASAPLVLNVVIELTEDLTLSYTLRGNLIIASWNPIEVGTELIRYAAYMKKDTPFATEHGGDFDPDTNPYTGLTNTKVWEGTSTQISIGNLPDGSILTYDEPYYLFVVAKYKHNGVETERQSAYVEIKPLSEANAIIYVHSLTPDIVDGLIAHDHIKIFVAAVPDASVSRVYGSIGQYQDGSTDVEFTKNVDGLYEYEFTSLADGKYTVAMYGEKTTGGFTPSTYVNFEVDTSVPVALPKPYITKDNTYVQTQTLAYTARTTPPISLGEYIDIYNSKTVQICLPRFTTCINFSHIKMYIQEYDPLTKSWSAATEYKLPQSILGSNEDVPNFKALVTFVEDMPDFRIKMVMVKKSGAEGSIYTAIPSNRSKIDTTPPLIKVNTITYQGDESLFNAVNNNYINAKLNVGTGLLFNLSITETNSGLWSNAVDEAALKIPVYYQINEGTKTPLRNEAGTQFINPYFIPKSAFSGITEGQKVTITIFALDNAMKVGSITMTKILDTTAPDNPTSVTAVFGVEANKGVIKLAWVNPANSDLAGIRIYEGTTLVKETTGQTASIPTPDGTTRTFVLKAYDKADNESTGVTKQAINYPPAQVTGVVATSDSGAVGLSWAAVTLDTGDPLADPPIAPEVMTDLKHYQLSYINPRTGLTVTTNYTNDTHFTIEMELADVTYFNANQNAYLTDIKIRAIDFFGAEGDYSTPTPPARPRFIEAVDMKSNIFKFVPSTDMNIAAGSLEWLVDANYKNSEYVVFNNAAQGRYVRLDMKPEYVPEVKLKFNGAFTGAVTLRVLIKYRQIDPVTFVESDVYLQSTTNDIANISESAVLNYANYIPIALTAVSDDNANTFLITLMKTALTKKSFYIKGVDLIIAADTYSSIALCEIQPRIRSIANDFYGETLYLSNMFAIRSSENTTTYLDMSSTALTMYNASVKSLVLGDLSTVSGSGYGLWAKDNIFLGGTNVSNAHVKINTTGVYLGYYNGTYYHTEITSGAVKLCYSPTISNFQVVADKDGVIVRDYTTSANNIYVSTNYVGGIGLGYKTANYTYSFLFYNTIVKNDAIYMGFVGDYSGYNNNTQSGSYNLQITSTSILLGNVGTLWNGLKYTNFFNTKLESSLLSLGLNSINHTTQAPNYNTVIGSNYLAMGFLADWSGYGATLTGNYNLVLDTTNGLSMYRALYSSYNGNPVKVHYGFNISMSGAIGIGFYNIDRVTNATIFNTVISGSEIKMGCAYLGNNVNVYNTKITSGVLSLGHISSGTIYALTMDYSSTTVTDRYFSIKGAYDNTTEYFRVGYFTTGAYSKYACWTKRLYVSDNYNTGINDTGSSAYAYIYLNEDNRALDIVGTAESSTNPIVNITSNKQSALYINMNSSSTAHAIEVSGGQGSALFGTTSNGWAIFGLAGTGGIGVVGKSANYYGVHGISTAGVAGAGVYGMSNGTGTQCGNGVAGRANGYVNGTSYYGCAGNFYLDGDGIAAVYALTSNPAYTALRTNGQVKMENLDTSASASPSYPLYIDNNNKVWKNTSSIKYKYDVTPFVANFERLVELQPRNFKWKSSGVADYGYIAEEVAMILPELVLWEGTDPNGVRYDRIALMLVEVAKRQKTEINTLTQEIALLMQQVNELKKIVDNLNK